MKIFESILIIILLTFSFNVCAQEDKQESFSMSAQLRSRGEYRNGALSPRSDNESAAMFINSRARLSMDYKRSNLILKLSGQHVGVWGQDPQVDKDGRFMLNEAWGRMNFNDFYVQIGRQVISYYDERILGALDWNTSGRFHDALKAGYSKGVNSVDLILAFNQNDEKIKGGTYYAPGGQPYKSMQTAWYHYGNNATPFNFSLLAMNLGWQLGTEDDSSNRFMQTMGAYANYKKEAWNVVGSLYYQTGKSDKNASVSAYMGSLSAIYSIDAMWAIGVGSDYLSGNDHNSSKVKAFNPLYGTHHKFYGTMDYFYASGFINNLNPGLWDNQLSAYLKASKKMDFSLTYHYFRTAEDVYFDNQKYSNSLGSELDFQINVSIMPDVKLMAGYSTLFGTKTMDVVKGGDHKSWQDWGWVSINITPKLFSTAK